jgi:hypothetical protein
MKSRLVAFSGLLNLALLAAIVARPDLAPPALGQFFLRPPAVDQPAPPRVAKNPPARTAAAWSALHSSDPAILIARLRAAGFPAALIRALVSAEVSERYDSEIRRLRDPDPDAPFWKLQTNFFMSGDRLFEELNRLYRERTRALRDLFKDDFFASSETTTAQRRQFGGLAPAKIDALQRIEDDYADMMAAVRAESRGLLLPEDREKLALLQREKKADLAALLSPQEIENYELRASQTANLLRSRLSGFEPTESEFRALYQAQLDLNEKFQGGFTAIDYQTRQELQEAHFARLRAALGESRYADYIRETSSEFEQLTRLSRRDNLPRETTLRAYDLRHGIAAESNQIFDHPTLSPEAKREALRNLAATARIQIISTLGPAAGPEFVRIANQWINTVERGAAVSFNRPNAFLVVTDQGTMSMSGSGATFRLLPPAPKP